MRLLDQYQGIEHVDDRYVIQQVTEQHERAEPQHHNAGKGAPQHQFPVRLEVHISEKGNDQGGSTETAEIEVDCDPPGPDFLGSKGDVGIHECAVSL